jgi:hypothetical protein
VKSLQTVGLIIGTLAVFIVAGLSAFLAVWMGLTGLFLLSRLAERPPFFRRWSWPRYLASIGAAFGCVYLTVLLSAGF